MMKKKLENVPKDEDGYLIPRSSTLIQEYKEELNETEPQDFGDRCALFFTMRLRWFADIFAKRYGQSSCIRNSCPCPSTVAGMEPIT